MSDNEYMKRALTLARWGKGRVSPNPMVGAVIVKDGTVLGKGYHRRYGGDHAEIEALRNAGNDVRGATLYCTLEPCSHYGKTPPCSDAIIRAGIARVVIAMTDPNRLVNGGGVKKLRDAGVKVDVGVLEHEARKLNEAYLKFMTTGMPFVTVKMAQTLDARISVQNGVRTQITSEDAQRYVHRLRTEHDAVLIGKNTAAVDDPILTPRLARGRVPKRILIDTRLELDPGMKIFSTVDEGPVFVTAAVRNQEKEAVFENRGVSIIKVRADASGRIDLHGLMKTLGDMQISSLLVEGGGEIFASVLRERLADRVVIIVAPVIFGSGTCVTGSNGAADLPRIHLSGVVRKRLGPDLMLAGMPVYPEENG